MKVGIIARVTDEEAKIVMRHFRLKRALWKRGIMDISLDPNTLEVKTYECDGLTLDAMQWVFENWEEIMADTEAMDQLYFERKTNTAGTETQNT